MNEEYDEDGFVTYGNENEDGWWGVDAAAGQWLEYELKHVFDAVSYTHLTLPTKA